MIKTQDLIKALSECRSEYVWVDGELGLVGDDLDVTVGYYDPREELERVLPGMWITDARVYSSAFRIHTESDSGTSEFIRRSTTLGFPGVDWYILDTGLRRPTSDDDPWIQITDESTIRMLEEMYASYCCSTR